MTTMITQQSLVSALDRAFRGVDACHCEGDGKLSRDELLSCFVRYQVLGAEYATPTKEEGQAAFDRLYSATGGAGHTLKRGLGVNSVAELCALTMQQLLRCSDVGWKKAHDIELSLAREGYYLRDSDREALAREIAIETDGAEAADMPSAPKSPEETKAWAADWLAELGSKLLQDGQALLHFARCLDQKKDNTARYLGKYAKAKRFGHASVAKLTEMICPLDDAVTASKRVAHQLAQAAAKAKRLTAPILAPVVTVPPSNVIALRRHVTPQIAAM